MYKNQLKIAFGLAVFAFSAQAQTTNVSLTETPVYSFSGGSDGAGPLGGLTFDSSGAVYGVTNGGGGPSGLGTVFRLTPSIAGQSGWTETVLHSFQGGNDGRQPRSALIFGSDGALYGTTEFGGPGGQGTIFRLSPPARGQTQWTETILYSFTGGPDGGDVQSGLVIGPRGELYGTTLLGGVNGNGVVYKLTPPSKTRLSWTEEVIYSFLGGSAGRRPQAGLVFGRHGALYGTTVLGGSTDNGTVFQLMPPPDSSAKGSKWTETVLYSFSGSDGARPTSSPVFGVDGNLYGTAYSGGIKDSGAVYRLVPPARGQTQWGMETLYMFTGGLDGALPISSPKFDVSGNLFGVALYGGVSGKGVVYKLAPPAIGSTSWTESVLYGFSGGSDGANPYGQLIIDMNGALYGTAMAGGSGSGWGTVFKVQ